uniref:Reverse transcriptase zinc-binding domain-containing protein n=1 Tax=Lactuca sativa TaxID=4236 RepID=A0A9R1UW10_LACSA|nr:hypothetical protein LSAT_V11C800413500 [Lactuca sativa]
MGIINHLEKLKRRFLWGGYERTSKIHWVFWSKVLALMMEGRILVVINESINRWIFKWCGLHLQRFSDVTEFFDFAANWENYHKKRNIFISICYCMLWCDWNMRNKVFNNLISSSTLIDDNVIFLSFI